MYIIEDAKIRTTNSETRRGASRSVADKTIQLEEDENKRGRRRTVITSARCQTCLWNRSIPSSGRISCARLAELVVPSRSSLGSNPAAARWWRSRFRCRARAPSSFRSWRRSRSLDQPLRVRSRSRSRSRSCSKSSCCSHCARSRSNRLISARSERKNETGTILCFSYLPAQLLDSRAHSYSPRARRETKKNREEAEWKKKMKKRQINDRRQKEFVSHIKADRVASRYFFPPNTYVNTCALPRSSRKKSVASDVKKWTTEKRSLIVVLRQKFYYGYLCKFTLHINAIN